SSVDLPEPDRPISTQISPSLMVRLAPLTPITCPVASRISERSLPASSSGRALAGCSPKTMSTLSKVTTSRAVVMSAPSRAAFATPHHPVENDGEHDDRQASLEAAADVHRVERPHHRLAQAIRTDQ